MEGEPGGAGNEPAPRPHAAASEPSKAAEESQAAPAGKAGSDATEGAAVVAGSPGAAGAASATAGLQSGWNQMQQGPTRHAVMTAHADASVECVAVIVSSRVQYPTGTGFETERPTVDIDVYTGGMKSSASATKIPIETFVKPSNHNAEQHSNPEKHSNQFPRILSVHVVRTIAATVPSS